MARVVRSTEDRVAAIDQKIAKKQGEIAQLEEQKNKILHPVSMKAVIAKAKDAGLTPEEIAKKLGIEI